MPDLDRKALAERIGKLVGRQPIMVGAGLVGIDFTPAELRTILAALRDDAGAEMRERTAQHCEARAEYFAAAPCHRDWRDAAHSYRATAKELRALPLRPASETEEPSRA